MRERFAAIRTLLSNEGSLWVTLDDNEMAYCKVLCDEVFGRANFVATLAWQKKVSPANDALWFSGDHDHILVYAKDKSVWRPNRFEKTAKQTKYYKNPDNDPRGPWNSAAYTCAKSAEERPNLYYPIIQPNTGEEVWPKRTRVWAFGESTHRENESNGLVYWGKDGKSSKPRIKRFLKGSKKVVPRSVWSYDDAGHTQEARMEMLALFPNDPFATPKPERLLLRVLIAATKEGDLVLDSFAGSGTTGAVAQKMGRRWIMVELGEHAVTHCVPRLRKVVDGADPGGVTKAVGCKGGGGFRFYRLAPSLLEEDKWGNWVINRSYNKEMLAEAMCKMEGFRYAPSKTTFWMHGQSTETDFIYVTTQTLTHEQLQAISAEVGDERTLLICCSAFRARLDQFPNLTVKKIPAAVLARCEWGKDDYSLNVETVMGEEPEPEPDPEPEEAESSATATAAKKRRSDRKAKMQELPLFARVSQSKKNTGGDQ